MDKDKQKARNQLLFFFILGCLQDENKTLNMTEPARKELINIINMLYEKGKITHDEYNQAVLMGWV